MRRAEVIAIARAIHKIAKRSHPGHEQIEWADLNPVNTAAFSAVARWHLRKVAKIHKFFSCSSSVTVAHGDGANAWIDAPAARTGAFAAPVARPDRVAKCNRRQSEAACDHAPLSPTLEQLPKP